MSEKPPPDSEAYTKSKAERKKLGDSLLPYVDRLCQAGMNVKAFVEQPAFRPCFEGTGFDRQSNPGQFISDIEKCRKLLNENANELTNFLKTSDSLDLLVPDQRYPLDCLVQSCEKLLGMLKWVLSDFEEELERSGYFHEPGDSWYAYFESTIEVQEWETHETAEQIEEELAFEKWVGRIQKDVLEKLKMAAESAIYVEMWRERIVEQATPYVLPTLRWHELTEIEKKIINLLANCGEKQKTTGQIADELEIKRGRISGQLRSGAKLRKHGLIQAARGTNGGFELTEAGRKIIRDGEKRLRNDA